MPVTGAIFATSDGSDASSRLKATKYTSSETTSPVMPPLSRYRPVWPKPRASTAPSSTPFMCRRFSARMIKGTMPATESSSTGRYSCQWLSVASPRSRRIRGTARNRAVIIMCRVKTPKLSRSRSALRSTARNWAGTGSASRCTLECAGVGTRNKPTRTPPRASTAVSQKMPGTPIQ